MNFFPLVSTALSLTFSQVVLAEVRPLQNSIKIPIFHSIFTDNFKQEKLEFEAMRKTSNIQELPDHFVGGVCNDMKYAVKDLGIINFDMDHFISELTTKTLGKSIFGSGLAKRYNSFTSGAVKSASLNNNAWFVGNINGKLSNKKNDVETDASAKLYLQKVYKQTGSLKTAKEELRKILAESGCNEDIINKYSIDEITDARDVSLTEFESIIENNKKIRSNFILEKSMEFASEYHKSDPKIYYDEHSTINVENWIELLNLTERDIEKSRNRWELKNLNGSCARNAEVAKTICDGSYSAQDHYNELFSRPESLEPVTLTIIGIGVGVAGLAAFVYDRLVPTDSEKKTLASFAIMGEIDSTNIALNRKRNELKNINNDNNSNLNHIVAALKLTGKKNNEIQATKAKLVAYLKSSVENDIKNLEKKVEELKLRQSSIALEVEKAEKYLNEKSKEKNTGSPSPEFMSGIWLPKLNEIEKKYKSCTRKYDPNLVKVETGTSNYNRSCNTFAVRAKIGKKLTNYSNLNQKGVNEQIKLGSAVSGWPVCEETCIPLIEKHLKKVGFDGGLHEFCTLHPIMKECSIIGLGVKQIWEKLQLKENELTSLSKIDKKDVNFSKIGNYDIPILDFYTQSKESAAKFAGSDRFKALQNIRKVNVEEKK